MTKIYEFTNHPNIFKNCYWGNFDKKDNSDTTNQIIENRNRFIFFNRIKCYKKMPRYIYSTIYDDINGKLYHFYDHVECYRTYNNNYILICSPYGEYDDKFDELGWTKIDKLYSHNASTYMKIIEYKNKKSF